MERGSVVGTASVFLDLSFGVAPAIFGLVAEQSASAAVVHRLGGVSRRPLGCVASLARVDRRGRDRVASLTA